MLPLLLALTLALAINVAETVDGRVQLEPRLDFEEITAQQRVRLAGDAGLQDGEGVFELSDAVAHLCNLAVQPVRVCEDEPASSRINTPRPVAIRARPSTHLVPWPVVRLPLGQMDEQPRRLHDEHGTVLSHLSLRRRHSAQDMAPLARLNSCSCALAVRSLSSGRRRAVWGIAVEAGRPQRHRVGGVFAGFWWSGEGERMPVDRRTSEKSWR